MAKRPNLLFLWTDEQRADTLAVYGNRFVRAPHLNALANESIVFRHAYCTQTVCTPSRSSVMTGLYPHTNGCLANNIPLCPETPTIAEMVSDDYRCGYYGKWHLGDEVVPQHGFDRWRSIEDNYRQHYSRPEYLALRSDYHRYLVAQGYEPDRESLGERVFARRTAARLPEPHTKAAFLGREAAEFIRRQDGDRPWMLYVNFLEPHMPFTGPYDDLYPPDEIPVGPHFMRAPAPNASALHRSQAEHYMHSTFEGHDLRTEAGWRTLRARYLGLVTLVDRAVGEILGALEASGQAEDTIVVYTSDHGDMMGDHGILAKAVQYEEAMRVPLLVRVPWLHSGGRVVDGRVSQIDLVPTLLDVLGEPAPAGLQGHSRADVLRGAADLAGNDVVVEWNARPGGRAGAGQERPDAEGNRYHGAPWRCIVTADGWKLNLSPDDHGELYHLSEDPYELVNLYDSAAHQPRIRDLAGRIAAWQRTNGDAVPLPHVA
jgi:arylsulfatase